MFNRLCKLSTAANVVILMVDSADHITGKAGLTLTITASKDGGSFSSISPTVTDLGSGLYKLALTTSHTDTLGELVLHITSSGADPRDAWYQIVSELPGELSASAQTAVGSAVWEDQNGVQVKAGVTFIQALESTRKP